jgi:hypothetical protein
LCQGDLSQAYDALISSRQPQAAGVPATAAARGGGASRRFQAAALAGVLRHRQWCGAGLGLLGGDHPLCAFVIRAHQLLGPKLRRGYI